MKLECGAQTIHAAANQCYGKISITMMKFIMLIKVKEKKRIGRKVTLTCHVLHTGYSRILIHIRMIRTNVKKAVFSEQDGLMNLKNKRDGFHFKKYEI